MSRTGWITQHEFTDMLDILHQQHLREEDKKTANNKPNEHEFEFISFGVKRV
jgi:hypothetical protein